MYVEVLLLTTLIHWGKYQTRMVIVCVGVNIEVGGDCRVVFSFLSPLIVESTVSEYWLPKSRAGAGKINPE